MKFKLNFVAGQLTVLFILLFSIQGKSACNVPTGLTTTSVTSSSAVFGWSTVGGASSYKVRYKKTSSTYWTSITVTSNNYSVTGLSSSTSYYWKVLTSCSTGNSSYSSTQTFTTSAPCTIPSGLSASSVTSTSATLNWNVVSGASSYSIQYRVVGTSAWTSTTSTTNSKSVSGLTSNSNYEFQLKTSCTGGGQSSWSASSTFVTLLQSCATPTGLNTNSITTSGATLAWTIVTGAASYNIQYRQSGGSSWTSTSSTTNSKSISGLTSATTYEFQVQTVCSGGGTSSWSASSNFTTSLPSCSVPTNLTSSSITTTSATLGWTTVNGAVSYNIQYRVSGGSNWTSATSTTNSKSLTSLASSTTYEFQVQTVCSGNSSSWSASATFTTQTPCGTPTGLSASSITQSSAIVNWNAAGGALSYTIQYRKTGTTAWSSTTSSTTSKTLSSLSPATSYDFGVMTNCSGGNSSWSSTANFTTSNSTSLPVPDHIVVLLEENHGYSQIIGSASAPYINALANDAMSTSFTQAYGVEHPSQPNYLDLFSGGNQGITNDNLPAAHFTTANLAREILNAGKTFTSYSQTMPSVGYDGASFGKYMRKHNPVANWMGTGTNQVSSSLNQPFSAFPSDYTTLPTVSFVIPDQDYDMHDGTIAAGDTWFHNNLDGYVQWAKTHNSLFILIFDEDNGSYGNRIPMIFTGQMVKSGTNSTTYNHYNVLRTIEDMLGTTHAGNAASASPIHGCWLNGYKEVASLNLPGSGFKWEVFPNPASTTINISYELDETFDPTISVYDNLGQKITTVFLPETGNGMHEVSYSTAELRMKKGIYFFEIQAGNKKYLKKIVVLE